MQFKIDENLPIDAASLIRSHGFDCLSVYDEELTGCPDSELIDVCREEKRILITLDIGFGDIRNYPPGENEGIIVMRLTHQDKQQILAMITNILPRFTTMPLVRRLWIVEQDRIRIRS